MEFGGREMFSRHSEKLKFGRKIFGEVGTYRISAKDEKVVFFFCSLSSKRKREHTFSHMNITWSRLIREQMRRLEQEVHVRLVTAEGREAANIIENLPSEF